jgi:hypothetical protein
MRMLTDDELRTEKGIRGSDSTYWRKRNALRLFRARYYGPRMLASPEPLADKFNEAIAAGHSEEEATIIAERHLAKLLALEDGHSEAEAKLIAEAHVTKLLATKAERDAKAAQAMATAPPRRQKRRGRA